MGGAGGWSDAELAVAADWSLSNREIAERVGRSEMAVKQRRSIMRLRGKPVPEGLHGRHRAYAIYGCRCLVCVQGYQDRERAFRDRVNQVERDGLRRDGIDPSGPSRPWTDAELAIALDRSLTRGEAARRLGRTTAAVQWARRQHPGGTVHRHPWREWTSQDAAIALDRSLSVLEVAQRLGRSAAAVKTLRNRHDHPDTGIEYATEHRRRWTDAETAIAVDRSIPVEQAARTLGRTVNAVRTRRTVYNAGNKPVPDHQHGTRYAYEAYGCRCALCVAAVRQRGHTRHLPTRHPATEGTNSR